MQKGITKVQFLSSAKVVKWIVPKLGNSLSGLLLHTSLKNEV